MKIKFKTGLVYFHQGWTDIINCLSLLDYYLLTYKILYLIIRSDSKQMIDYYICNKNIIPIYIEKNLIDQINTVIFFKENYNISEFDILYHGGHDVLRTDSYQLCYYYKTQQNIIFNEAFYTAYDIDYHNRINFFNLNRNYELENNMYDIWIKKYGPNYILSHQINNDEINNPNKYPIINLAEQTETFFDFTKILINAKELHLLDSVWAAIIYLLEGKYNLLKDNVINVYCKRGYYKMFNEPIKLPNWNII